jgi:branched-chain amino acid transport system substrate-binding protein
MANQALEGTRIAAEEINAAGGILGRPIELIVRDEKGDPAESARQARDLIDREKVFALLGTTGTAFALAVSEVTKEKKVPYITYVGSTPLTAQRGHRYVVNVVAGGQVLSLRPFVQLFKERGWKRIYFAGADYAFVKANFQDLTGYLPAVFPEAKLVGQQWPKFGETNYLPNITAILTATRDFDVMLQLFFGGDFINFTRQSSEAGLYDRVKAKTGGVPTADVLAALKGSMPKGFITNDIYPYYRIDTPLNKRFVEKVKARGQIPGFMAQNGWASVQALKTTLEKAGAVDREKMMDVFDRGISFETPAGKLVVRGCDHQTFGPVWIGETDDVPGEGFRGIMKNVWLIAPEDYDKLRLYYTCEEVAKLRRP